MTYFNTTSERGQTLMNFTNMAGAQDIIILDWFQSNRGSFTAWQVWEALEKRGDKMLFTSVRRGINTLVNASLLTNTGEKIMERYNRPCFKFTYNG